MAMRLRGKARYSLAVYWSGAGIELNKSTYLDRTNVSSFELSDAAVGKRIWRKLIIGRRLLLLRVCAIVGATMSGGGGHVLLLLY